MAHGFLEAMIQPDKVKVYSAGLEAHGLNPGAVKTMEDAGISIAHHSSNVLTDYLHIPFDFVITVCDHASEQCPIFPGQGLRLHHNFSDPSKAIGNDDEIRKAFEQTREEIRTYMNAFAKTYLPAEVIKPMYQ